MQFLMCKMMTSFVSSGLTKATLKMHRNDKTLPTNFTKAFAILAFKNCINRERGLKKVLRKYLTKTVTKLLIYKFPTLCVVCVTK